MNTLCNMLLVYPKVPKNTYWSFQYALRFTGKRGNIPPLGLLTVAALFPPDVHLKLIDLNVQPLSDQDLQWADAVFISAMIVQKHSFQEVVKRCRHLGKLIVAGGPYPTVCHQEIHGVDHFVLGEVEECFELFIDDLRAGRADRIYEARQRPDIGSTVVPRFDLLDMRAYASMAVQYSRGCPFRCEFCDIWQIYGNTSRLKSSTAILQELTTIHEMGWRGPIFIVDDNFIGNKRRVKHELLPALRDWQADNGYPFRFYTEASINMATDRELLAGMRACGFDAVFVGIETPCLSALRETGKVQNLKTDMPQAVHTIQRFGIEVMAGFIMGFDNDPDDIAERQIAFIQETGIPQAMVGLLIALPGTQLYRRLQNEDRLLAISDGNNTHCLTTNFKTRMPAYCLKESYKKVLSTIYDPYLKKYFARCNVLLDRLGCTAHQRRRIRWNEIKILLKSLGRQPFTLYGFQYLKFMARHLFQKGGRFPEAVKLSIVGHHFHTMTRALIKGDQVVALMESRYREFNRRLQAYSSAAQDNYREGIQNVLTLWQQMAVTLKVIHKKVERVHIDFRGDIKKKYLEIAQKMEQLLGRLTDELQRTGIR